MTAAAVAAARIDHYDWPGGREAVLRYGPVRAPVVVVALPLLEEANRTRALAAGILRVLAMRGIAGMLPDLPGTGESLVPTSALVLANLRAAFAAAVASAGGPAVSLAIRSGALLDGEATVAARWHLSPQEGGDVAREWRRLQRAGGDDRVAGNALPPALWSALAQPSPTTLAPCRTVRLDGDPRPADHRLPAVPPWRRAEPDGDPPLAAQLAGDIADWIAACVG